MLGKERALCTGRMFGFYVSDDTKPVYNLWVTKIFKSGAKESCEVTLSASDNGPMIVHLSGIASEDGKQCFVSMFDIFDRMRDEQRLHEYAVERERIIQELQFALEHIKTLQGFIPICSKCKKIRDDEGFWNQLEKYFHDHTDVIFTHGLCPECGIEMYGDQYTQVMDKIQKNKS